MDDVDYLVEDNAMDDFCLSPEMDGTHGKSTLKMILDSNYREGQPMGNWHNGGTSWEQSLERKMRVCNTIRRDDVARFAGNELG